MASWYSKWFGKWFSGWFYKTPTPPVPPQPPTPPAGSIQSRAPVDSPSILSGVRAAEEEDKKRSETEPIECVEYEDGIDGITKADKVGCIPGAPPPPDPPGNYPVCQYLFPRKVKVVFTNEGGGIGAKAFPDIMGYIPTNPWEPLQPPYAATKTTLAFAGELSEPMMEFTINGDVEKLMLHFKNVRGFAPWGGSTYTGGAPILWNQVQYEVPSMAMDLYSLDAIKKGKKLTSTTVVDIRKYGPDFGGGLFGNLYSLRCQQVVTTVAEFQEVTVAHLLATCLPVLPSEINLKPVLRLNFFLARYFYSISEAQANSPGSWTPANAYIPLGGNNWNSGAPGGSGGWDPVVGWPGCGVFSAFTDVNYRQGIAQVLGSGSPNPNQPGIGVPISTQFIMDWGNPA